jgi:GNAT superfamily N-acetyltransferase
VQPAAALARLGILTVHIILENQHNKDKFSVKKSMENISPPSAHTTFELRPVTEQDRAALLALYRQCEDFIRLGNTAPIDDAMVQTDLEISQRNRGIFLCIWLPDGVPAGVADYVPAGFEGLAQCAFIELLMIGRPWRGRGLGTAVLKQIEQRVWGAAGVTTLRLGVQVNNPQAINFWEVQGFSRIGGPTPQPDGTVAYLYEKKRGG